MTWPATLQKTGDYVTLGGYRSPGLVTIQGASSPRKWEERNGYGLSGAWTIFLGIRVSNFSLKFALFGPKYTSQDWIAWKAFHDAVLIKPPANTRPKVLDIWHPDLEPLQIKSVGIEEVLAPVQGEKGEWVHEVKLIEYRLPKMQMAKPEGSQSKPTDPYDQKIDELTKQLDALSGR